MRYLFPQQNRFGDEHIVMPDGTHLTAYTMGIGNPHCVILVDSPDSFHDTVA